MAREKHAYELLGIPRDAAPSLIRTQFRAFLRRYQPEASTGGLLDDPQACQVINAYLLLTTGDRASYDRDLGRARRRQLPSIPNRVAVLDGVERLLLQAELALIRLLHTEAAEYANRAREQTPGDARPYALLGDIAREQKKYDTALTMYNYAVQFDPDNERLWQLLNETTELKQGRVVEDQEEEQPPTVWQQPVHLTFIFIGILAVSVLATVLVRQHPGKPLLFGLTDAMLVVDVVVGVVVGFLCAASGLWNDFGSELVYHNVLGHRERAGGDVLAVPVGVVLLVPALITPWLGMLLYLVIGFLDEHLSPSIIMALGIPLLISILNAFAFPDLLTACLVVSGTFVFIGIGIGWLLGSLT